MNLMRNSVIPLFKKIWSVNKYMCIIILISLATIIISIIDIVLNLTGSEVALTSNLLIALHIAIVLIMPLGWNVHAKQQKLYSQEQQKLRDEMIELAKEIRKDVPDFDLYLPELPDLNKRDWQIRIIYFSVFVFNLIVVGFELNELFN